MTIDGIGGVWSLSFVAPPPRRTGRARPQVKLLQGMRDSGEASEAGKHGQHT